MDNDSSSVQTDSYQTQSSQIHDSTADFYAVDTEIQEKTLNSDDQDIDVEKSLHLVPKAFKRDQFKDKLNFVVPAQNTSIKFAEIDHFKTNLSGHQKGNQSIDSNYTNVVRSDKKQHDVSKKASLKKQPTVIQATEQIVQPSSAANLPIEFQQARTQLKEHYEGQIKALLEEIQFQKELIERTYAEKLKKEMATHDDKLQNQKNDSEQLVKQINQKQETIQQLRMNEEILNKQIEDKEQTIQSHIADQKKARAECHELREQLEAAFTYMSLVKQSDEALKFELQNVKSDFQNLGRQDLTQFTLQLKAENETLRQECIQTKHALEALKQSLKQAIQTTNTSQSHFSSLLEMQTNELIATRSQITEYEKREKHCLRKWTAVLKENTQLQCQTQELQTQLKRQKDQFQHVITINERNLVEANRYLSMIQSDDQRQKAAFFLVQQIKQLQEERHLLLQDNQTLALQINDLILTNTQLKESTKFFDHSQLVSRVEQLEDIISEFKTASSVSNVLELRQVIVKQAQEITELSQKKQQTHSVKLKAQELFDQNELYESFQKMMRERDSIIQGLASKIKSMQSTAGQTSGVAVQDGGLSKVAGFEAENQRMTQALHKFQNYETQVTVGRGQVFNGQNERGDWLLEGYSQNE